MDLNNPIIQLCMEGSRAEFEHRINDARLLYDQAWRNHKDDYEACIAAHYVARFQETLEDTLHWNQAALNHADAANDERVRDFYPSLFVNLGHSYEALGDQVNAQSYYQLAAEMGVIHHPD
jgi:hypothetical protein